MPDFRVLINEPMDQYGNIWFNRDEGIDIPCRDRSGADISVIPLFFNVLNGSVLRKALDPDPDNSTGRRLILSTDELENIKFSTVYSITDESGPTPIVLAEGFISERVLY